MAKYEEYLRKQRERNHRYRQQVQQARAADPEHLRQLDEKERLKQERLLEKERKRSERSAQRAKISTLEQLHTVLSGVKQKASQARTGMRKAEKRMKEIAGIQSAVAVCQEQKPVHDKYLKIGWKKRQAAFAESHQEELKAYNKAYRYLKAQHIDLNVNLDALEAEYTKLQADHAAFARQLEQVQAELNPLNEVRYWVGQVLGAEQVESQDKAEGKQSVVEQLRNALKESEIKDGEKVGWDKAR